MPPFSSRTWPARSAPGAWSTSASIWASTSSASFTPWPSKNLIPLSWKGLWEAETTAARSKPSRLTRIAAAGVGSTPPSSASPPAAAMPAASAASSIGPDSRVSRTIRTWGRSASREEVTARPKAVANSALRKVPASPRTPSVPKSLRAVFTPLPSALAELRLLAGLLQPGLAALLDAGVTGEEAPALEIAAKLGVDLGQRPGDPVTDRAGLAADPTAVDADADVNVALVAGDDERLLGHRLVQGPRKELLDAALVDFDLAVARHHSDASDRALAFAGGEEAGAFLHFRRSAAGGGVGLLSGGELGFAPRFLFFLSLEASFLLSAKRRALRLDQDRLQVSTGNDVFLLLLSLGLGSSLRGSLLSRLLGNRLLNNLLGRLLGDRLLRGRGRGLRRLVLRSFVLLRRFLVVHHQFVSIVLGCCAA